MGGNFERLNGDGLSRIEVDLPLVCLSVMQLFALIYMP